MIRAVAVFCGASSAVADSYKQEGKELGRDIAKAGLQLVYGAANCGVMGAVANGALESGGKVFGVFPRVLDGKEGVHNGLQELLIVDDMHTRKQAMFNRSDAFIVFPGGFGTMDETFEVITWKQLHTHKKPILLYNFNGYWDRWVEMTEQFIEGNFASQGTRQLYEVLPTRQAIMQALSKA
jgi:uncharacterized protein (TIGR00730 family)